MLKTIRLNLNLIKDCNSAFYIHNSLTSSNQMFKLGIYI